MAATLASARRSLLTQEASRLVRKAAEVGRWKAHFASAGRIRPPRLSWVNFEFLRSGRELADLLHDLHGEVWDRKAIAARLEAASAGRSIPTHPLSDYLMKVYTIDLSLRAT